MAAVVMAADVVQFVQRRVALQVAETACRRQLRSQRKKAVSTWFGSAG